MSKTLIIIILILIIIGLYFAPQITKVVLKKTGQATAGVAKNIGEEIIKSDKVQDAKEKLTEGQIPQEAEPQEGK